MAPAFRLVATPPPEHDRWRRDPDELFDAPQRALFEEVIAARPEEERAFLSGHVDLLARDVDRYDGEVATVDAAIGALVDELNEPSGNPRLRVRVHQIVDLAGGLTQPLGDLHEQRAAQCRVVRQQPVEAIVGDLDDRRRPHRLE